MQQIGNVFYNLLNMMGSQNKDERMIGLSNELREMIQSRKFDNLFDNNVPYAGFEKVNLLKTQDLSVRDQANLIKAGLGDILHHPTAQIMSSSIIQQKLDLGIEHSDPLQASQIQIKFISYKTPNGGLVRVPQKFYFQMRFFTFQPIMTDYMGLQYGADQGPGGIP